MTDDDPRAARAASSSSASDDVIDRRRPARPLRALGAPGARPARAQGRAVEPQTQAGAHPHRPAAGPLPAAAVRRRARAPPVRLVRDQRRGVRRPGQPRPAACSRSSRRCTGPAARRAAIVASLVRAAEAGKQVVALVELKARFDEQVERRAGPRAGRSGRARRVRPRRAQDPHQGAARRARRARPASGATATSAPATTTPVTANLYEDLGLLTADPDIGADLTELFNYLTGYSPPAAVPPAPRRAARACATRIVERIRAETALGPDGRIVMKMNSLVDPVDRSTRCTPRRPPGRPHRPHRPRHLLPAARASPGCRRPSGCARSSAGSSSTRGSTASAPIPRPRST